MGLVSALTAGVNGVIKSVHWCEWCEEERFPPWALLSAAIASWLRLMLWRALREARRDA